MMVTVTTVSWIHEADSIRILLESNGIQTQIPDQSTVTAQPFYAGAIGGIRVQVEEADLPAARSLLQSKSSAYVAGLFQCPRCDSPEVEYQKYSKRFAFLCLFFFGLPLLWQKRQCICHSCGQAWQEGHNNHKDDTGD